MKSEDCTATLKYSYDSDDELTVPAYCHTVCFALKFKINFSYFYESLQE